MNSLDFFKKSKIYNIIERDIKNSTLNHTYMLQSLDIDLINEYAFYVAQCIFCENKSLCGECLNCQKVKHSNHSDILVYPKNTRISVEESREISDNSFVLPFEGDKKIYILKNFDLSTVQAQNALLKTLEEPCKHDIFILTVQNINNVVATIRSRSKIINEQALSEKEVLSYLVEVSPNNPNNEIIAGLSDGLITNAKYLINDKNAVDISDLTYEIMLNMKKSNDVLVFSTKVLKYKTDIEYFLNCMMRVMNMISIYLIDKTKLSRYDLEFLNKMDNVYNIKMLNGITDKIVNAKEKLTYNCNIVSVVDKLLLDILEVKYLCQTQ